MLAKVWPFSPKHNRTSDVVWLDLGDLGDLVNPNGPHEQWQDHGLGLLRTILHQNDIMTDVLSTRAVTSWDRLRKQLHGYKILIMNVRSYTFPVAYRSAKIFKEVNPDGLVLTGGSSQLTGIRQLASEVMGLPARVARPENLIGMVDRLHSPSFSTSVGLVQYAMRMKEVDPSAVAAPKYLPSMGNGLNWAKIKDVLKRFLP